MLCAYTVNRKRVKARGRGTRIKDKMKNVTCKRRRGAEWVMALVVACAGMLATGQEQQVAQTGGAAKGQELRQDPLVTVGTLKSGLRYIIRPTKEPAGRGSVRLRVGVGSLYENEQNTGFSHLLEHMVFNGSRNYKRGELIPVMQKLGLGFGGDANAYTSLLETVYMLDLPDLKEKTVDTALTIMRDFADGATLEDEAIEKERGIVISELKARDSAELRAHVSFLGHLTEGTRLAEFLPIGKEEVLRHGSPELVRQHYRNFYVPEKMTLVLTGDFDPREAEGWVKKHFEGMQERTAPTRPDIGQLREPQKKAKIIPNDEKADVSLFISVVKPYREKPDTAQQRAEELPINLACAMLERRMRRLTHEAGCPFTQAATEHQDLYETAEVSALAITARPEKWRDALQAGVQELRRAMSYGFTDDELKEATDALLSNLQQACATWETATAPAMADRLVQEVGEKKALTDAQENQRVLLSAVQRILQEPDLCRRTLVEAFDLEGARLALIGQIPKDATEDALGEEFFDKALKEPVQKKEESALKPFAYETIGMPGAVLRREPWEDLGVTAVTLSNGVKVNLKPVDFRKGTIAVTAAVDGGLLALPAIPGLANMTSAVMNHGGLQEHSRDELERLMAAKQVTLDFAMTPTRFLFSGSTSPQDLELQCKLLAAAILYPGYREEGERLLRRNLDNEYRELTTTPKGALVTQSGRTIFGNNPLFTVPKREELEARSTEEVQRAMAPLLGKNYTEVTLVGDFDVEATLPILERTFGAMPQRLTEPADISPAKRQVETKPWGERLSVPYSTKLDKTIVARVHAAGNGRDQRRNRRLNVLASVLRNQMLNGLRATLGESYSPKVQVRTNDDFDNMALITAISYGVKRNHGIVSSALESICNGIGQGNISDDEFQLAIRPFLATVHKQLASPDYWESNLIDLQSNPERRALLRDVVKDVESITAEEIRALGREIFGKDCQADLFYVVPEGAEEPLPSAPAESPTAPLVQEPPAPAPGEYAVLISADSASMPDWKSVAQALLDKYPGATLCVLPNLSEQACTEALRKARPRYAAAVLRPQEVTRAVTNALHRAARNVDNDPYGDCIWGIVTGYEAEDALRIAQGRGTIVLNRLLTVAQPDHERFEQSYCMSEKQGCPITERNGNATTTILDASTPEGKEALQDGLQDRFAYRLATQNPQLLITATPSTPFNLEMPLCKGLIFPSENRFYSVGCQHLIAFSSARQPAMEGKTGALQSLTEAMHFPAIEPDAHERVWLALGTGAMGDARGSRQSMVITAVSGYGCHQFVGFTIPSWYGEMAANLLHFFLDHTDDTTLAQAVFLANQLLIARTISLNPRLMQVHLNGQTIDAEFQRDMLASGVRTTSEQARDAAGLVLERDALVFYGDPARPAIVSSSHQRAPLTVARQKNGFARLTANRDFSGPAALPLPTQESPEMELPQGAVKVANFLLFPNLTLKKDESLPEEKRENF